MADGTTDRGRPQDAADLAKRRQLFVRLDRALLERSDLTLSEKVVLATVEHLRQYEPDALRSQEGIARAIHLSARQVRRTIDALRRKGWLTTARPSKRGPLVYEARLDDTTPDNMSAVEPDSTTTDSGHFVRCDTGRNGRRHRTNCPPTPDEMSSPERTKCPVYIEEEREKKEVEEAPVRSAAADLRSALADAGIGSPTLDELVRALEAAGLDAAHVRRRAAVGKPVGVLVHDLRDDAEHEPRRRAERQTAISEARQRSAQVQRGALRAQAEVQVADQYLDTIDAERLAEIREQVLRDQPPVRQRSWMELGWERAPRWRAAVADRLGCGARAVDAEEVACAGA